ncbi:putative primase [Polaromonas phage Tiera]|nr:putative primase [Polaromonas phage Tiera]
MEGTTMSAFFTEYMNYVNLESSEAPANYHRWACASMLGALMGRQVSFPFGSGRLYPNQFVMLMGPPATKKGTAIGIAKKLMEGANYARFAPDRTSKEAFVKSMKQFDTMEEDLEVLTFDAPSESYITSGEFVDFIGQGDIGFLMLLTNLWDNLDVYEHTKITGKSITVTKPTVSLLSGSTAHTFMLAFPPDAMGTGTLSRFILVDGDDSGRRVAWPEPLDPLQKEQLIDHMQAIKNELRGDIGITKEAKILGAEIYTGRVPVNDERFAHYMGRRHIHLIKLAMLMAVSEYRMEITETDILRSNTMLAMAEMKMPKALGEFGASRNSAATDKIMSFLNFRARMRVPKPANAQEIYKIVSKDVNTVKDVNDIIHNLKQAERIQVVSMGGITGYLPLNQGAGEWNLKYLDLDWLTKSERLL